MNFIYKIRKIIPSSLHSKFIYLFLFTLIGIFLELLGIGLVLPIITIIVKGSLNINFGFGLDENLNDLLSSLSDTQKFSLPLIILLAAYTIKLVYLFFLGFYNAKFCYLLNIKLSEGIYKNFLFENYLFHLRRNSSDLIRIINSEINFFIKSIILPILIVIMEILIFIGITFLLFLVDAKSTIFIILIFGVLGFLYFMIVNNKLRKWGEERILHEGLKLKNLTQGLNGIKIVKIFNKENIFINKFNLNSFRSAKVGQYASIFNQIPRLSIEFISVFLLIIFMLFNVENSSNLLNYFPKIALFGAAAFRLLPSINRLANNFQILRYASPVVSKIYEEFPLKGEENHNQKNVSNFIFNKEIKIENLSFKYPENNENILENITLEIKSGESIGIVGETGSGKSTLVDIICGLLRCNEGSFLIDGHKIKEENIKAWQQNIGYVPQNVYLLDDTIKENIIFGKKTNDRNINSLSESIKSAQLENLISNLPNGLETIVGERGARLSGGQIQRIGIARALDNNPKLLIFDESTSALDTKTERELIKDIIKLKANKTLILISHRLSVLENCDRIYEVKDKKIFLKKYEKKS